MLAFKYADAQMQQMQLIKQDKGTTEFDLLFALDFEYPTLPSRVI